MYFFFFVLGSPWENGVIKLEKENEVVTGIRPDIENINIG